MHSLSGISLRQLLTVPYVALLLLCAIVIGLLSYMAGRDAVDSLSNSVLSETVSRIAQAIDKHVAGSEAVLETVFPAGIPSGGSIDEELDTLRTRLWLATSIHRDLNNYAYYGNRNGEFVGLYRYSASEAELRLRRDGISPRAIYRYSGMGGKLEAPVIEERVFEPRQRPWYEAGQAAGSHTWTAVYIDFKTLELVSTRARRVFDESGEFSGVVATDVSLELLNRFLDELRLTDNGFAFIVEPDGNLIASSRGPHVIKNEHDVNTRLNAADSDDPLILATYQSVRQMTDSSGTSAGPATGMFTGPDGAAVQTGYMRLRDDAGLDWIVAVAVPRADFMFQVTRNVRRTVVLALLASALIGLIGYVVLHIISRDLRQLAVAACNLGDGIIESGIPVHRSDEIGELARSFQTLQQRLLTDRLTGIANREAVLRYIEDRTVIQRRSGESRPFAVLFIDLNGFKRINDQLGHETGDLVLREVAERLSRSVQGGDLAARYGGDEFVVVLNQVDNRNDALAIGSKIKEILALPLQTLIGSEPATAALRLGAAIGVALCPDDGADPGTLINQADADMYRQKSTRDSTLLFLR
ncbi:MAG: GGDEF domain-containing protein [Granulosicoccus sp.]|nr:GGDEF domain-containing protein [Granulosicoccus sp.]